MKIRYLDSVEDITPEMLSGFFDGWPKKPSPEAHLQMLHNSTYVVIAFDEEQNRAVGFVNAVSDKIMAAYLPLLEVLPEYRKNGIGGQLMRRILDKLDDLYMIDLVCDEDIRNWYKSFGMKPFTAMMIRNFDRQAGRTVESPEKQNI